MEDRRTFVHCDVRHGGRWRMLGVVVGMKQAVTKVLSRERLISTRRLARGYVLGPRCLVFLSGIRCAWWRHYLKFVSFVGLKTSINVIVAYLCHSVLHTQKL